MEIKTSIALDAVLREGFQGKAVELMADYAHHSTLLKMRADIDRRIKLISGPLYLGEAEFTLLVPLCNALRFATSDAGVGRAEVARHAYQLAATYALIFDISKISQSRDIANQITLNSIALQPIIARMTNYKPDEDYKTQMTAIWKGITTMMQNVIYRPNNNGEQETPLYRLFQATSGDFDKVLLEENTVDTWNSMLSHLRHGKGTPLDRAGRKGYMALLTEILMRLDLLIDASKKERVAYDKAIQPHTTGVDDVDKSDDLLTTSFIDAYTAMYWLIIYLEAIAQYDVIFPASDLMVQSQAWVLVIKTQSAKLKKLFVDIAQVAAAYDIFTGIKMWNEVRRFYDPLLNHSLSAVSNMDTIWAENVQKAEKLLSGYAKSQVDTMFDSFKAYMGADYLLPERQFAFAGDMTSLFAYPEADSEGTYVVPTGRQALLKLDSVGEKSLGIFDRDLLIPGLANSAGDVELALAFIKRSREVLQLTEELDDIYHALLPSGVQWENPYALEGKVTDMCPASFTFKDPMQLCYEKYTVTPKNNGNVSTIASIDWYFSSLLMKPFYRIPQLQTLAEKRSPESRLLWPGIGQLPVGDIITAEYVAQPIPACYTASRNANFVNNDFSAYLTLMSGHSGVTAASRDMFRKLAAILDRYEDTYARSVLDALSATMFVYWTDSDGNWHQMIPSVPTIYGVPTAWMVAANEIKLSNATEEAVLKRSVRVSLDNGKAYQFVLHNKMPKPGPMMYVSYPYAKGVYLQVPLLRSIFEANSKEFTKVMRISFSAQDNASFGDYALEDLCKMVHDLKAPKDMKPWFISTLGWAPYLINLPHILCSYQDEEDVLLSEEYAKYAMMSVRVRYDAVERAIYVGGFVDNPVELLTVEDYDSAVRAVDPSPLPTEPTVEVPDAQPEVKEPNRSEAEPAPDPATLGAAARKADGSPDKDEELKRLGTITQAPVVSKDAKQKEGLIHGDPSENLDKTHAQETNADALAGAPATSEKPDGGGEDAAASERYWKKVSASGEIEDVVKAKECPSGYVPASEDEYREFLTKAVKESSKEDA